ncbi:DUF4249 domain-containing protein [Formosa sp. PL04]|uniref:DUF4249 domain-containing protein n=1 Tax=Formosa sp. PL04 TaxID=3081755 RepID=UPI0029816BF0|nr:DUF4249 domain-containing protein [Formosa sp. PL04]MDW5288976.1 DUF4249 domain-containing protein [Formosa sp. PL04]
MKNTIYICFVILFSSLISCTDVVDIEVPTAAPRLVIEASVDWQKETFGTQQTIKLSTTTPFFDTDYPNAVIGAQVTVTRERDNALYVFEDQLNGEYTTTNFGAGLNDIYTLNVIYEDETFTATETLLPTTDITRVTQSRSEGFYPDVLELNVYFEDPADETNFYLLIFREEGDYFPTITTVSDEYLNGNEIHVFFEKEEDDGDGEDFEFEPGDTVSVNLYNISEEYYNFMQLLNSQSGSSGNPFAPAPVEIRGNCINITDANNYPYGFFRVTETAKETYTFVDDGE